MKKNHTKKGGYTVIELVFYVILFVAFSIVLINSIITMTRSVKETSLNAEIQNGASVLERITREIRQALDINSITSTTLNLSTTDDAGNAKTVEFLLNGTNVELWENGALTGNINSPNIHVSDLSFSQITTTQSKAVKITMDIYSVNDTASRVYNFYDTIVLRGIY